MSEQMLWVEKYRPKTIEECILPESIKATFQEYVNKKQIPNLLLSGTAGVGKTTIARALCEEVGCDYIIINGSDESGIDTFRTKIKNYASSISFSGGRKVIIIDEADYLNPNSTQPALRGAIEEFSSNCSFIFTCNYKNRIIEPIHSRCSVIDFRLSNNKAKMAALFFKRVEYILRLENIEFSKEVVAAVVTKHFPDNRRILNEIQRYSISGSIDKGLLGNTGEIQIKELIKALREKDFGSCRKWVTQNLDNDASQIFRALYDNLYDLLTASSVPQLVLILARYQYQSAFVSDLEINITACLTEIMIDCEFK
ncbi:HolB ATPase involved in DNA replication [uncultured Caudovirales phage]|uniref:Sliding-clamp-loader large subunit n=1 Tax=uncultured Caudovirales phage TaxID=2100421 RepID=A0A6J5T4Z0_9CAUD|nr:HolB ATPase involved in DNA replication [uncultured Caudovirales phage]